MKPRLSQQRPVPDDFTIVAPGMSFKGLQRHYRTGDRALRRWCAQTGVEPVKTWHREPPPNWAELCAKHHQRPLLDMLSISRDTIRRWQRETGIGPLSYNPPREPKPVVQRTPHARHMTPRAAVHRDPQPYFEIRPPRSTAECARDFLASNRGMCCPVFRCDEKGRAGAGGKFWRIGNSCEMLSDDELIRKAKRRGWVS